MTAKYNRRRLAIRGLMLDPARLVERHEFYFDLLPKLAEWGFNTLWWHFVDDEGFALKLRSHPELATPYAFTKAETRRFIKAAADCGIEVVPEVESLGHGRYITRLPQYAHLADGPPHGFNAVCPSHRDTVPLLREVIEEVAELFDSGYFHAGLDEVNLSGCKRCARRARGKARWWIFAEHVKTVHEIIAACGKRMIMWADHVEKSPAMLKVLPKDIVMAHWQYGRIDADAIERSLDAGFEVIGAPAMMRHRHVIQPHRMNAENTENMIAAAGKLADRGVLGVVNTWWTGRRILRDAGLPMAAYTGHLLRGGSSDKVAFFRQYLHEQFGLRSIAAARALWTLHDKTLMLKELGALLFDSPADMLQAIAMAAHGDLAGRAGELHRATGTLATSGKKVKRNRGEFKALVLAGKLAGDFLDFGSELARADDRYRRAEHLKDRGHSPAEVADHLDKTAGILAAVHKRLDRLCGQVAKEWDRTRHPADVKKALRNVTQPCPVDSLLGRMARSRAFLAALVRSFARATKAYRRGGLLTMKVKGGPFPTGV